MLPVFSFGPCQRVFFLDIEFHVPDGKGGAEVTHRWVVKDEVLSFRGGDREACEKATVHICEKGIYAHVI